MTLLLNGSPIQFFHPKRGLRQGDPISPYLFIVCMEVLSRLINRKVEEGLIKGFCLNPHTPPLHHLFFANDIFLMGKCSIDEAFYFKGCLDDFCHWSDQSFNSQKSNIFFNRSANRQVAGLVTTLMGFSRIKPDSAYLGLPLFRSGKVKDFYFLVDWLDAKLAGWKAKILSKAKKLVLIKSVVSSLPTYVMQTVKISASICSKLDARIRSFWWGYSSNSRKLLCLKAWDSICKPKACGGLGLRKMGDFNRALLAEWGWNLLTNATSLYLSVLRSRYIQYDRFFDILKKIGDSPFWKVIIDIRNLLVDGACYVVGDGNSIDLWKDP
ncbi:hypothetical protein UlMin_039681 [Ulmus minor]